MESYDVVIVGASFSGLTLAHHLPASLRVLVVDAKPAAGSTVESTGLITEKTRLEFASFFDIDRYITNPITAICVVASNFEDHFVSTTDQPWIYQTDTKALVRALADTLPANVELRTRTVFSHLGQFSTQVLVGADGGHSKLAALAGLEQNKKFLFGYEQVFFGNVHLGPKPEETIYHFWFGEFSLGYGGWLSPTVVNGHKAFRIGLAKFMKDRGDAKELIKKFINELLRRNIITIDGDPNTPDYFFGSHIPIGGALKGITKNNVLLIGDAAGLCGAFAADGIKGSVVSGKEAATLISRYLDGDRCALSELPKAINTHGDLMGYYKRQVHYRFVWDRMKRNRTFDAMYRIIEAERDTFLDQFCDSKDTRRSLAWTVLKWKHISKLLKYSTYLLADLF